MNIDALFNWWLHLLLNSIRLFKNTDTFSFLPTVVSDTSIVFSTSHACLFFLQKGHECSGIEGCPDVVCDGTSWRRTQHGDPSLSAPPECHQHWDVWRGDDEKHLLPYSWLALWILWHRPASILQGRVWRLIIWIVNKTFWTCELPHGILDNINQNRTALEKCTQLYDET